MHPYATNSPAPLKLSGYLMLAAIALSAGAGALLRYTNASLGWSLGSVSAMALFTGLYLLFDRVVWRRGWARRVLLVPDLNGEWLCVGRMKFKKGQSQELAWTGTITIRQSWSRIAVVLRTPLSASSSIAASLYHEPGLGFRLLYHFDNKPQMGEKELARHVGLCNLLFNESCDAAEGEYFTDQDRMTAGTMRLRREEESHAKT